MLRFISLIVLTVGLSACVPPTSENAHPIIQTYSESYNTKDIETMTALMHPSIEWVAVKGNEIEVHISGKDVLMKEMQTWFENPKLPKGVLRDWSINGDYVAVTETASWTDKEGAPQSQSALTVYQLEDGLIRRVYYYPEQK